jgi:shikimate 5-dehydrogenase
MAEKRTVLSRRGFLLTLGAGGAATAAAIATRTPDRVTLEKSKDKRATRGYQVTEHVNNYYRTTKV